MARVARWLCAAVVVAGCGGKSRELAPPDAKAICEVTAARADTAVLRSKDSTALARAQAMRDALRTAGNQAAVGELERFIAATQATTSLISQHERHSNKVATMAGRVRDRLDKIVEPALAGTPALTDELTRARKLGNWQTAIEPLVSGRVQGALADANREYAAAIDALVRATTEHDGTGAATTKVTDAGLRMSLKEKRVDTELHAITITGSTAESLVDPAGLLPRYLALWSGATSLAALMSTPWPPSALAPRHVAVAVPRSNARSSEKWAVLCVSDVSLVPRPGHAALSSSVTGARDALSATLGLGPSTATPAPTIAALRAALDAAK